MKIPNYIAWAAQIIVADKLGIKVDCLDIAKQIINTKNPPEMSCSISLEIAAFDANQTVCKIRKIDEANRIGDMLLKDYKLINK